MSKYLLAAVAALALTFTTGADRAEARGLHFRAGGLHVDVGSPHRGHRFGGHTTHYRGGWGGWGGHSHWHNTSHYDWHAPQVRWHGNHFDFTPGHWDYHRDGHWDHH